MTFPLPDALGVDALKGDLASVEPWEREFTSPLELLRATRPATVALPGATAQPIHVEPAAGHHLDKPGRAPSSDRGPAVEPSSSEPTKNGATGGNRGAATTKE